MIWVGLGGYDGASELEQIGTAADCSVSGREASYGWFDFLPYPGHRVELAVRPGDVMAGSVGVVSPNVVFRLEDRTRHWVFARSITMQAAVSSAEWITEAPLLCRQTVCSEPPLSDFGSVTFTDLSAVGDGQTGSLESPLWTATPFELASGMVGSQASGGDDPNGEVNLVLNKAHARSTPGAAPTQITPDGSGFTVVWHS